MGTRDGPNLGLYFFEAAQANMKKALLGGYYIHMGPFIYAGLHVSRMSALVGMRFGSRLDALMGLVPITLREGADGGPTLGGHLKWLVGQNLLRIGREPESFIDYWAFAHYPVIAPANLTVEAAKKLGGEKLALGIAMEQVTWYGGEGLAFGAMFPAATKAWLGEDDPDLIPGVAEEFKGYARRFPRVAERLGV